MNEVPLNTKCSEWVVHAQKWNESAVISLAVLPLSYICWLCTDSKELTLLKLTLIKGHIAYFKGFKNIKIKSKHIQLKSCKGKISNCDVIWRRKVKIISIVSSFVSSVPSVF